MNKIFFFIFFAYSTMVYSEIYVIDPALFDVEEVANINNPTGIAIPSEGSAFNEDCLFISSITADYEGNPPQNDYIYKISKTGEVTIFAILLPEADPMALVFPPTGSIFGDYLYVDSNNRDGGQPSDKGGSLQRIDPNGVVSDFSIIGLPNGLGEPCGFSFGLGGDFGFNIYISNASDIPFDVGRINVNGQLSSFINDGLIYPNGLDIRDVAFPETDAFQMKLYCANSQSSLFGTMGNNIRTVDHHGIYSGPFCELPGIPMSMAFSSGGGFGDYLYVAVGNEGDQSAILRINPDGNCEVFALGTQAFNFAPAGSRGYDSLKFSNDGNTLYVADKGGSKIYQISVRAPLISGPVIIMREPRTQEDGVHSGQAIIDKCMILWSENINFSKTDINVVNQFGEDVQFGCLGDGTDLMTITFSPPLYNNKYVITIKETVMSAETGNSIDGDEDGQSGGNAVIFMEHRQRHDSDNDNDIDLVDLSKLTEKWLWQE